MKDYYAMISMPRPNWKLKAEYLENENARLRAALEQIEQWAQAYPLNVFPEPILGRQRSCLQLAAFRSMQSAQVICAMCSKV